MWSIILAHEVLSVNMILVSEYICKRCSKWLERVAGTWIHFDCKSYQFCWQWRRTSLGTGRNCHQLERAGHFGRKQSEYGLCHSVDRRLMHSESALEYQLVWLLTHRTPIRAGNQFISWNGIAMLVTNCENYEDKLFVFSVLEDTFQ